MSNVAILSDLAYGGAIGLALGITGTGGSILTLPVLVYLVGEDVHTAISTSLAVVGGIAAEGFIGQRDRAHWKTGLLLGAFGIAGSVPGSLLSAHVPGRTLLLLFSILAIVAAITMLWRQGDTPQPKAATLPVVAAVGVAVGFLTGFLGVGVGFVIVPTVVFAFSFSMQTAIPTSLLVIAFNSLVSLITRSATASIDWGVAGAFLAGGIGGNAFAAFITRGMQQRQLKQVFGAFILLVGLFTGSSALGIISIQIK